LPKELAERWNTEINRLLKTPEVKARMEATGLEVAGGTQEQVKDLIAKDIDKWKLVVRTANIKL
jgi:tripartite-type tricarboxylate transporter receptor subunit TctC